MGNHSKLLMDESPLQVLPSLAVAVGLNEAIVLQQMHWWLMKSGKEHDGRDWVHESLQDMKQKFPFWSERTIRRTIDHLQSAGLLLSALLSEDKRDRTRWFSIDYERLQEACNDEGEDEAEPSNASGQNGHITSGQNGHMEVDKMATCSNEHKSLKKNHKKNIRTPISQKTAPNGASSRDSEYSAPFTDFWSTYPKKTAKDAAWKIWKRRKLDTEASAIIAKVEQQKTSPAWTNDGGQYIPYPATYLNQGRWKDEDTALIFPARPAYRVGSAEWHLQQMEQQEHDYEIPPEDYQQVE